MSTGNIDNAYRMFERSVRKNGVNLSSFDTLSLRTGKNEIKSLCYGYLSEIFSFYRGPVHPDEGASSVNIRNLSSSVEAIA